MINDRLAANMYLKKAAKTAESESGEARKVVAEMLADIEKRGEPAVREYAQRLDGWHGEIVVNAAEIERRTRDIPAGVKRDIEFATERVRRFALASTRKSSTAGTASSSSRPMRSSGARETFRRG